MIELNTNWEAVARSLGVTVDRMWKAAEIGAVKGMDVFMSKIQKEQMSGRPGLMVRTGNLRRSWNVRRRLEGKDTVVSLGTATKYAAAHQFGMTIKHPGTHNGFGRGIPIPPHDIKMPKRLNVIEDFAVSGKRLIISAIARELYMEAGRK